MGSLLSAFWGRSQSEGWSVREDGCTTADLLTADSDCGGGASIDELRHIEGDVGCRLHHGDWGHRGRRFTMSSHHSFWKVYNVITSLILKGLQCHHITHFERFTVITSLILKGLQCHHITHFESITMLSHHSFWKVYNVITSLILKVLQCYHNTHFESITMPSHHSHHNAEPLRTDPNTKSGISMCELISS